MKKDLILLSCVLGLPCLGVGEPLSPVDPDQAALLSVKQQIQTLSINPADRAAQRRLFESAKVLAASEERASAPDDLRPKALRSARRVLAREQEETRALYGQVNALLSMSRSNDPLVLLEASRQAEKIPLADDPGVETYLSAVYDRLGQALKDFKDPKAALEAKGFLQFHDKNWGAAKEAWAQALKEGGPDPRLEGMILKAEERRKEEERNRTVFYLLSIGTVYHDSGQHEKAVDALGALLKEDPKNEQARRLWSESRAAFEAQERVNRVLENVAAGMELKKRGRYLEASNRFLKALQTDPANATAHRQLQDILALLADAKESTSPEEKTLPARREDTRTVEQAEADYRDGLMRYIRGEKGKAKEFWEKALRQSPSHRKAKAALEQVVAEESLKETP